MHSKAGTMIVPPTATADANKERCAESYWILQTMLQSERSTYSCIAVTLETSGTDYAILRGSLIDVLEEIVCEHLPLQNTDHVLAIAISYLDRFAQYETGCVELQLAAATCLYLSIKTCDEPNKIKPDALCELFQQCTKCEIASKECYVAKEEEEEEDDDDDYFDSEDLQAMELKILKALHWNLNPPTAMTFVHQILACLPRLPEFESWEEHAKESSRVQLEVARRENSSTRFQPSTLAVASLFTTVEKISQDRAVIYKYLLRVIAKTSPEDQKQVLEARGLLKELLLQATATDSSSDKSPLMPMVGKKRSTGFLESGLFSKGDHSPPKRQKTSRKSEMLANAPLALTSLAPTMV
jgi:hypothetical protein